MKLLYLSASILLLTTSLFAQNFEIGVNGGAGYNTSFKNVSPNIQIWPGDGPLAYAPATSLKGIYHHNKWEYGISIDYRVSSYKRDFFNGTVDVDYAWPYGLTPAQSQQYLVHLSEIQNVAIDHAEPYYPISFFINKEVSIGRFKTYGGLSVGYIFIPDLRRNYFGETGSVSDIVKARTSLNKNGTCGISAGLQIGTTYFITKRVGINAELAADYVRFYQGILGTSYAYSFPATVGIRYRL